MANNEAHADELEIRSLVARLARAQDTGTVDEYLAAFTDDAVVELQGAPTRGGTEELRASALAAREAAAVGPSSGMLHHLGGLELSVTGDDASGYMTFVLINLAAPAVARAGRYDDRFRRTTSGWRVSRRQVTFH
jgi:ketosteroid isomerase-like protein